MTGIDQDKLEGLRELIKLLLALTRTERPKVVYPYLPFPPPVQPGQAAPAAPMAGEGGMNLVRAAQIVERGSAHALEAIRKGTDEARKALLQLAEQRDVEQQAVEQVIDSVSSLKALQHKHRHPCEADAQQASHAPPPHGHVAQDAHVAGARRKR